MPQNHFIALGRVSPEIAGEIVRAYTPEGNETDLKITRPTNVFQSRIGSYKDGECIAELFINGPLDGYPVSQYLSEKDKQSIADRLNGAHVTIVHSISGENAGNRAMSLLDYVYELKTRYKVGSITLIAPYAPMRVDRRFSKEKTGEDGAKFINHQRNAIVSRNLARRLRYEGVDRIITFDPHSKDSQRHYRDHFSHENTVFESSPVRFIRCPGFLAAAFKKAHAPLTRQGNFRISVGSPDGLDKQDDLGVLRARDFALTLYKETDFGNFPKDMRLEDIDCMFGIAKDRQGDGLNEVKDFSGNVKGKICALIDDIDSSGGTKLKAARRLKEEGAKRVISISTHGVLVDDNNRKALLKKNTQKILQNMDFDTWNSLDPQEIMSHVESIVNQLVEETYVNTTLRKMLESPDIDEVWLTDSIPGVIDKIKEAGYENHPKLRIVTLAPMVLEQIEWDKDSISYLNWAYPEHVDGSHNIPIQDSGVVLTQ